MVRKAQIDNEIQASVPETESTTVNKVVNTVVPPQQPVESNTVEKEDMDQDIKATTKQEVTVAVTVASNATNVLIQPSTSDPKPEEALKDSAECKEGAGCCVLAALPD